MGKKPLLILVSGVPASGKTTISKKLSSHFRCPLFSADEIKEIISDRISGREDMELFKKVADSSFDIFYKSLEKMLEVGRSCIAEALFIKEFSEARIKNLQKKYKCRIIQVYLKCDKKRSCERYDSRHLTEKRHKSHIAKMSLVLEKYGGWEKLSRGSKLHLGKLIEIDTNNFRKINYIELYKKIAS